jgi:hypothetical protein
MTREDQRMMAVRRNLVLADLEFLQETLPESHKEPLQIFMKSIGNIQVTVLCLLMRLAAVGHSTIPQAIREHKYT